MTETASWIISSGRETGWPCARELSALELIKTRSTLGSRLAQTVRLPLPNLFLESTDMNLTHGLSTTYLQVHGTSIFTPWSKYNATAYREEYCTVSKEDLSLCRKSWMEPFKFRSCGVGMVTITESNSEEFSLRSVTCHVLAIRELFSGFSSVLIALQCFS